MKLDDTTFTPTFAFGYHPGLVCWRVVVHFHVVVVFSLGIKNKIFKLTLEVVVPLHDRSHTTMGMVTFLHSLEELPQ